MAGSCKTYFALSLIWAVLLLSCTKEPIDPGVPEGIDANVTSVVHYIATVGEGKQTKASLNNQNQYIFETGDQLYVTSGNNLYGILNLVAGAGDPTGTFEGDLMCLGSFEIADDTSLSATLVSKHDKIHTCSDGLITDTVYPCSGTDAFASSFLEAIKYFSDFTATSRFDAHAFSLEQQSTFLIFSVTFDETEAAIITASGSSTITATFSNGGSTIRSGDVTVEVVDFSDQVNFVVAFPSSPATILHNAAVAFTTQGASPEAISTDSDIATGSSVTLQKNRYYEVSRSHVDLEYFTIQAKEDGTTVTFKNTGDGLQYKKVGDASFTDYNSVIGIPLDAGEYVQFRGKKTTLGTTPLFTADKTCFIYGNLMSLICDNNYAPKTVLANNAFKNAFNGATWIDIPSGRPLKLPAKELGEYCYYQMFRGCTSLTRPPELQTALDADVPRYAYTSMFYGCTSLVSAPNLQDGHSVGSSGYEAMFSGCTSLLNVPATIAGTSGTNACKNMFYRCRSLTNAPEPTSLIVGNNGYEQMFFECTSLAQAPNLPATSLGTAAYKNMFKGCTSLISAPASLPAGTLAANCYELMFKGCLTLSIVPATLPATASAESCYANMFEGCISLNHAPKIKLEDIGISSCSKMFFGCTSLVTAEGLENAETVDANGCYQMFYNCGELTTTTSVLRPLSISEQAYYQMYYGCAKITEAPDIKATSVGLNSCYQMFYGCRRLRKMHEEENGPAPALSIGTVADCALKGMFQGCSSLSSAPAFTGMTTVGEEGCMDMFNGCTNLTKAPELPATSLSTSAYKQMFCDSGITAVPALLATTLAESCYESMFQNCHYLEGPAVLPAESLADYCYKNMFNGASILNSLVCLATTNISTVNCETWLEGVAATGTFVRPDGVSWTLDDASGIPEGWTVQDSGLDPIFPDDGPFNPEEDL